MRIPQILPLLVVPFLGPMACAQNVPSSTAPLAQSKQTAASYTFVYRADKRVGSVSVAGTFNGWDKNANPMRADADGLTWRATLSLRSGNYGYKFVLDGANWVTDPATKTTTEANGNPNSLLSLSANAKGELENASAASGQSTPGNANEVVVLTPDKVPSPDAIARLLVFRAGQGVQSVSVAGEFNGWNKNANPMRKDADGVTWRTSVLLDPGSYQYKFVLDGDKWTVDPLSPTRTEADGNVNSLLLVTPPGYDKPASPDDGQTTVSALRFEQSEPYLNSDRGLLRLRLRTRANDLRAVSLVIGTRRIPMTLALGDDLFAFYDGSVAWDGKSDLSYRFELTDGGRVETFGADGLKDNSAPFRLDAKTFRPFVVPNWVEKTVFYQIFPDRFEDGDKSNDPANVSAWDAAPTGQSRFGGDLAGVKQHLPYLQDLGITGVYFNPVFASPSNHRYDTFDYKRIDPQLGTNAQFAALTRDMKARGIRTVMDFAFNHTATSFPAFADVVKNGAASPYKDWYLEKSFPVRVQDPPNYLAYDGFPSMPKLNTLNPPTRDYLLGVADYWEREVPLAGLRLDVGDEVDIRFWRGFRSHIKAADPEAWIVGERWSDASPWLKGDQWDSAMNYPFLFASADFFADGKTSASTYAKRLMTLYNAYPPQVSRAGMNLLSSHDTPRFLTRCKGDARLQQLAATVQFTWPGTPSIYYGEELGMEGGADPANRRGMEWKRATAQNPMLAFYKKLIAIRGSSRALQSGEPKVLVADDAAQTLVFSRTYRGDGAIIALNRSNQTRTLSIALPRDGNRAWDEGIGWRDALSGRAVSIQNPRAPTFQIELPPLSSAILLPAEK